MSRRNSEHNREWNVAEGAVGQMNVAPSEELHEQWLDEQRNAHEPLIVLTAQYPEIAMRNVMTQTDKAEEEIVREREEQPQSTEFRDVEQNDELVIETAHDETVNDETIHDETVHDKTLDNDTKKECIVKDGADVATRKFQGVPIARIVPTFSQSSLSSRMRTFEADVASANPGASAENDIARYIRPDLLQNQLLPPDRPPDVEGPNTVLNMQRIAAVRQYFRESVPNVVVNENVLYSALSANVNQQAPIAFRQYRQRAVAPDAGAAALAPALGFWRPIVMESGTIRLLLRDDICVDISIDQSVRVLNRRLGIAMAVSSNSANVAFIHTTGRLLQAGDKVEMVVYDGRHVRNYIRYCKIDPRGMTFATDRNGFIYYLDSAGVRSVEDDFATMNMDFSSDVFFVGARYGNQYMEEAQRVVDATTYCLKQDNTETYTINGFMILQKTDGFVQILRNNTDALMATHPLYTAESYISTNDLYVEAVSHASHQHFFVYRGIRFVRYDGRFFNISNGLDYVSIDENDILDF